MPGQRRTKRSCFNGRPFGNIPSLPGIRLDETKVIGSLYLLPEEFGIREALDAIVPPGGDLR